VCRNYITRKLKASDHILRCFLWAECERVTVCYLSRAGLPLSLKKIPRCIFEISCLSNSFRHPKVQHPSLGFADWTVLKEGEWQDLSDRAEIVGRRRQETDLVFVKASIDASRLLLIVPWTSIHCAHFKRRPSLLKTSELRFSGSRRYDSCFLAVQTAPCSVKCSVVETSCALQYAACQFRSWFCNRFLVSCSMRERSTDRSFDSALLSAGLTCPEARCPYWVCDMFSSRKLSSICPKPAFHQLTLRWQAAGIVPLINTRSQR